MLAPYSQPQVIPEANSKFLTRTGQQPRGSLPKISFPGQASRVLYKRNKILPLFIRKHQNKTEQMALKTFPILRKGSEFLHQICTASLLSPNILPPADCLLSVLWSSSEVNETSSRASRLLSTQATYEANPYALKPGVGCGVNAKQPPREATSKVTDVISIHSPLIHLAKNRERIRREEDSILSGKINQLQSHCRASRQLPHNHSNRLPLYSSNAGYTFNAPFSFLHWQAGDAVLGLAPQENHLRTLRNSIVSGPIFIPSDSLWGRGRSLSGHQHAQ